METEFQQKRVNHIFHYTKNIESLLGIISEGFFPSYCKENITNLTYLIPMVSFCNISIRDVNLYMRYGTYGIGLSIEWAIKNRISPVIYIHENSPFNNLHGEINKILIWDLIERGLTEMQRRVQEAIQRGETYDYIADEDRRAARLLSKINNLTVPALQFFKNWKVEYHGQDIITYQEREWRYIPQLDDKRIIPSTDEEFENYTSDAQPKPHLPNHTLQINSIDELRYIIINKEEERGSTIKCLCEKFDKKNVVDALFNGRLLILSDEQVKNDF